MIKCPRCGSTAQFELMKIVSSSTGIQYCDILERQILEGDDDIYQYGFVDSDTAVCQECGCENYAIYFVKAAKK